MTTAENQRWCYVVATELGISGFCEERYLAIDPPEPTAQLRPTTRGERLATIAEEAYGKSTDENNSRLYVQALYLANRGRAGVQLDHVDLSATQRGLRGEAERRTLEELPRLTTDGATASTMRSTVRWQGSHSQNWANVARALANASWAQSLVIDIIVDKLKSPPSPSARSTGRSHVVRRQPTRRPIARSNDTLPNRVPISLVADPTRTYFAPSYAYSVARGRAAPRAR